MVGGEIVLKKINKRKFLATVGLVIISTVVSLALAEILLRNIVTMNISHPVYYRIPHPIFGWVLEPNASYLNKMREGTVEVNYNSSGWRDTHHDFEKKPGTFRIVVLGDSFMEGYSVGLKDLFHKQLEQFAQSEGLDIEVINLGVGGYGTLQEYLAFQNIGKRFKPDIVLLAFYLDNDVNNNSLTLESILSTNSMKVTSRPFLDPSTPTAWNISPIDYKNAQHRYLASKARGPRDQKLIGQSALIHATNTAVKNIKNRILEIKENRNIEIITNGTSMQKNVNRSSRDRNDLITEVEMDKNFAKYGIYYCQEHSEYTEAWTTTQRILDRLDKDVASSGAELFVFTVPAIREVECHEIRNLRNRDKICWQEMPAYDRLTDILTNLNIKYLNLLPHFREIMTDKNNNLFRRSDSHWNENGHRVAAKYVHSTLKEKGLVPNIH